MTVKQLIDLLKKEKQDKEVILSRDEEGNGFEPIDESFGAENMTSYNDNDVHDCIILYPTGEQYEVLSDE